MSKAKTTLLLVVFFFWAISGALANAMELRNADSGPFRMRGGCSGPWAKGDLYLTEEEVVKAYLLPGSALLVIAPPWGLSVSPILGNISAQLVYRSGPYGAILHFDTTTTNPVFCAETSISPRMNR